MKGVPDVGVKLTEPLVGDVVLESRSLVHCIALTSECVAAQTCWIESGSPRQSVGRPGDPTNLAPTRISPFGIIRYHRCSLLPKIRLFCRLCSVDFRSECCSSSQVPILSRASTKRRCGGFQSTDRLCEQEEGFLRPPRQRRGRELDGSRRRRNTAARIAAGCSFNPIGPVPRTFKIRTSEGRSAGGQGYKQQPRRF